MIHAHVSDAWTRLDERATPAFGYLTILDGFAAPLFLWLAGVSLSLAAERALVRGGSRGLAWRGLVRRGLEIFVLAFAFRVQAFVFNPGGAVLSIFRVDILNVLGVSLAAAGLLWGAARTRMAQASTLAAAAAGVALITPLVRSAAWVDRLPVWCQWYLRPAGEYTVFTVLPWSGFVFAGAAAGVLVGAMRRLDADRRLHAALGLSGVALIAIGFYTASRPSIYAQSAFWTSSPTFFAIRVGILLVVVALLRSAALLRAGAGIVPTRAAGLAVERLGRASLFVYWVHVQLVYGWIAWPLRHRLLVWQSVVAFVAVSGVMYGLIGMRDRALAMRSARQVRSGPGQPALGQGNLSV